MTATLQRAAAGAGWLYAYRSAERLLDFLAVVVLARLLSPDDFGLVAIAASLVTIVEGLGALGIEKALIRSGADDRQTYDSAWTLSVLRGAAAGSCMVLAARFVEDARLAAIVQVLALGPIVNGFANPRFVMFERELLYSRLALLTVGARIVSVAITLTTAAAWRSYWALVIGLLANALASVVLSYALTPYRPRISFARFRSLFGFSGWLTLTSAVTVLSMETDRLIVGRLLGVGAAGLYDMTQRVGVLPTRELLNPLQRLLFPAYSQMTGDLPRLRRIVCESINVLASLSLPAGFGFALVAGDFVPLVLGQAWTPIVALLVVLSPYLGVRATLSMTLPCVLALGRLRMLFWVAAGYGVAHVSLFAAATAAFGLPGAVWSLASAGLLYTWLNVWMLKRTLDVGAVEVLARVRRPFAATALMCAAVAGTALAAPARPSWGGLVMKILVGVAACGVSQYVIWRLEGRPPGIERRVSQLIAGEPAR